MSRQRVWGVPLPIFISKKTGKPLVDEKVLEGIAKIFEEEGSDSWFERQPQDFLGKNYNANDYEQVKDIVEVWFDSGSTHSYVLDKRPELAWPANLYLEGINIIGLKRAGYSSDEINGLNQAVKLIFSNVLLKNGIKEAKKFSNLKTVSEVISFLEKSEKRAICRPLK